MSTSYTGLAAVGGSEVGGDGQGGSCVEGGGAAAHQPGELVRPQHLQQVRGASDVDGLRPALHGRVGHDVTVRAVLGQGGAPRWEGLAAELQ